MGYNSDRHFVPSKANAAFVSQMEEVLDIYHGHPLIPSLGTAPGLFVDKEPLFAMQAFISQTIIAPSGLVRYLSTWQNALSRYTWAYAHPRLDWPPGR